MQAYFDPSRPIRGICFDLFNTLVSVAQVPESVGRFTADILGVSRQQWNQACFSPLHEICRPTTHYETLRAIAHSIDPNIPHAHIETAVQERQRRFDHALSQIDPGTLAELQYWRDRGLRLALVSNASTAEIAAWTISPLRSMFDCVVFSCECGTKKPDAAIYHHALLRLGLSAAECLFIGDGGSHEHIGAHQIGMHPILLTRYLDESSYRRIRQEQGSFLRAEVATLGGLRNIEWSAIKSDGRWR